MNYTFKHNCKTCKIEFYGKRNQIYHSNECKFKDPDYINSQRRKKEFLPFKCNYCNRVFKSNLSGIFTLHLKEEHSIDDKNYNKHCTIISKEDYEKLTYKEGIRTQCRLCDFVAIAKNKKSITTSIATHISLKHDIIMLDYIKQFPEEEKLLGIHDKRKFEIESNIKNQIECLICHEIMKRLTITHLKKHNLTPTEYKKLYGNTVSINSSKKQSNITTSMNKLGITKISRESKEEIELRKQFPLFKSPLYINDKIYGMKIFDLYNEQEKIIVEYDGIFFHPIISNNGFNYSQLTNLINDQIKNKIAIENGYSIYRINEITTNENNYKEKSYSYCDIKNNVNKLYKLKLEENTIICNKEYLSKRNREEKDNIAKKIFEFINMFYIENFDFYKEKIFYLCNLKNSIDITIKKIKENI